MSALKCDHRAFMRFFIVDAPISIREIKYSFKVIAPNAKLG